MPLVYPSGSQLQCQEISQVPRIQDDFVSFNSTVLRGFLLLKYSEDFGSKQTYKCKELYLRGDATQTLGKPKFTWKQLVSQETDIIKDQSVHWEVIWGIEATSDFIANHAVILKQCVLQCYAQQRNHSNSREILLTSKRPLSYASKNF